MQNICFLLCLFVFRSSQARSPDNTFLGGRVCGMGCEVRASKGRNLGEAKVGGVDTRLPSEKHN